MSTVKKGIEYNRNNTRPEGFNQGEVLLNVHFRINTASYRGKNYNCGFDDRSREAFQKEMIGFLEENGFYNKDDGSRYSDGYVFKGLSKLHLHPDDISGIITVDDFDKLQSAMEKLDGLSKYSGWTDVYEAYEVVDEEEVRHRIQISEKVIEDMLLDRLKTKRKDRYFHIESWSGSLNAIDGFKFHESRNHYDLVDELIGSIIQKMVHKGMIKQTISKTDISHYYRSANKTEMSKLCKKKKVVKDIEGQGALLLC